VTATRFDHAVVAVRDLDRAIAGFGSAGFDVRPGGVHTGLGTHNAIIRFGLDYIELLAVHDAALAQAQTARNAMLEFLQDHEGLIGYAVATEDIDADAERFSATGLPAVGPFAMDRARPDGRVLSWRLLIPHGLAWRRPWPFLIQWDASDDDRLSWERPGTHSNGAIGVRGVRVLVRDVEAGRVLYGAQLGLNVDEPPAGPGTTALSYELGSSRVELLSPARPDLARALADQGEGLHELVLGSRDLRATRGRLEAAGLKVTEDGSGLHAGGPPLMGARLAFIADDH